MLLLQTPQCRCMQRWSGLGRSGIGHSGAVPGGGRVRRQADAGEVDADGAGIGEGGDQAHVSAAAGADEHWVGGSRRGFSWENLARPTTRAGIAPVIAAPAHLLPPAFQHGAGEAVRNGSRSSRRNHLRASADYPPLTPQLVFYFLAPESDWTGTASNIRIYNNLILDNMEFGMWLVRARGLDIHHNTIRTGCFTHGPGIGLDFDVDGSEIYANKIVTCHNTAHITISVSHDNHIHDNVHYSVDDEHCAVVAHDDLVNDQIKAGWAGIPLIPSSGNRVENDLHFRVGGALGEAIEERLALAEADRTSEEKGWFSCEIEEGVLDPDCVATQAALGAQGIPAWYLLYDPLMANPDPYVVFEGCPLNSRTR